MDFCTVSGAYLMISGAKSLLDLHNRESSWRRLKNARAGRLPGEQKRNAQRLIETF